MTGVPRAGAAAPSTAASTSGFDQPSTNARHHFRGGEQVAIVGLQSQPQLNGRCAFVGTFDEESGRFDAWVTPMLLSFGREGGLKQNWVDRQTDEAATAVRLKPTSMQIINLTNGRSEVDFEQLNAAQKAAVLRAQKKLYDEASMFKDGKRRPPNVISLFRAGGRCQLVRAPQPGVIPAGMNPATTLIVRRELDAESEGVGGLIYVVANSPKISMAFRRSVGSDGQLVEGKEAADSYLRVGGVGPV